VLVAYSLLLTPTPMDKVTKKQIIIGTVVSDVMAKTVVVKVDSRKRHEKYKKSYTVSKRYKAHDENNEYHVGDKVVIESTRPISKDKKFKVVGKAN
jgi:small subunit ribosomal protein S17